MTISATTNEVTYTGDGVTLDYAIPFYFLENAHLVVTLEYVPTSSILTLYEGDDYTVAGAGDLAGGTLTSLYTYSSSYLLTIQRVVPLTQILDLVAHDSFSAESMEAALDRLTMIAQQQDVRIASLETSGPGGAMVMANVGAGAGNVYKNQVGSTFNLKSIKAGTNVTVTNDADEVVITSTAGGTVPDGNLGHFLRGDGNFVDVLDGTLTANAGLIIPAAGRQTLDMNTVYDLYGASAASSLSLTGTFAIATAKQNMGVSVRPNASLVGTAVLRCYDFDAVITASDATTDAYGIIGNISMAGAGSGKGLYGRVTAAAGCTGVVVGMVAGVTSVATAGTAWCLQLDHAGPAAGQTAYVYCGGDGTNYVANGIVFGTNCKLSNGVFQWNQDAAAVGSFLRMYNNAGTLKLFDVNASGSVLWEGTGVRLSGDLTNATLTNRMLIQTNTVNGISRLGIAPNGTGTSSGWDSFAASDILNSPRMVMSSTSVNGYLNSTKTGTGTTQPLDLQIDGVVKARITAAGRVLLGNGVTDNSTDAVQVTGDLAIVVAGNGLKVKEGTNARMGVATLVAGTVTVGNTSITANTRVFAFCQTPGGTPGWLQCSARTVATDFTILSSNAADTSTVAWILIEPSA